MPDTGKRYWVLIVEDDPSQVMLIKAVFAHYDANAHITVARSAEEAIAHIRGPWPDSNFDLSELPDVIVLDVVMDGLGGLGFLAWYAGEPRIAHVHVVVFTASQDEGLGRECLQLGAREFKVKPVDFSELVPVVQRVMNRCHAEERHSRG